MLPPTGIGPGLQAAMGTAAFVTTAATLTIPCPFRTVLGVFLQIAGALSPASDENVSVTQTIVNETISNPPGGTLTVTRTGAVKTSGLQVMYVIFGR